MSRDCFYVGIDPGVKNLGVAILVKNDEDFSLVFSGVFSVQKDDFLKGIYEILLKINSVKDEICTSPTSLSYVCIERFVPYKGMFSDIDEEILMIIGALKLALLMDKSVADPVLFMRAIDWKIKLSKMLYKKGFRNPVKTLNKTFSSTAANFILNKPNSTETSHEADAICLAYMAYAHHQFIDTKGEKN